MSRHNEWILILDYGSQPTQLIARRLRELNIYEIHPYNVDLSQVIAPQPSGIILSGGPMSVNDVGAPQPEILEFKSPILGIYGLQLLSHNLNPGSVERAKKEYGRAHLLIDNGSTRSKIFRKNQ